MILAHVGISILPVLGFLAVLVSMDSYKLLSLRSVLTAVGVGVAVAAVCFFVNVWLHGQLEMSLTSFSRYIAPLIEETLKACFIVFLIRRHRIGFLVDAAIIGFAIGTGFAVVENIHYLQGMRGAGTLVWIVRGFGTAIMHGSTTAIFAILSKGFADRGQSTSYHFFLPGLLLAIGFHSLFNHFVLPPLIATGLLITILPALVIIIFARSEKATRNWLGIGFDTDVELLDQIETGELQKTRVGKYLDSLKDSFPPLVLADLLCYLQVHLELSLRAKGLLLAKQTGLTVEIDDSVRANLRELRFLERSVGRTGRLALQPLINLRSQDLWQLYMLDGQRKTQAL